MCSDKLGEQVQVLLSRALLAYCRKAALNLEPGQSALDIVEYHLGEPVASSAGKAEGHPLGLKCICAEGGFLSFEFDLPDTGQQLRRGTLTAMFRRTQRTHGADFPLLAARLQDWENGARLAVEIELGSWSAMAHGARVVREAVFVAEQGVAVEEELDEWDPRCLHAVAFNMLQKPVATGRLLPATGGRAHIGRIAVLEALRGRHLGQRIMRVLETVACARGDTCLELGAQLHARGFYESLGYRVTGPSFQEVGIPHVCMRKELGGPPGR